MQNSAIESRTQLRLNVEIEEQKQKLADLKITKEQERAKSGIYLLHNLRVSNEDYSRKRLCTIHVCVYIHLALRLGLFCSTPLSATFQLYRGGQFYW